MGNIIFNLQRINTENNSKNLKFLGMNLEQILNFEKTCECHT